MFTGFAKEYILGKILDYSIKRIATTPYKVTKRRNGRSYEVEYNGNWNGK